MIGNLHPDDLLFFNEVAAAMRVIAKRYDLPLRKITAASMPQSGMADFMGRCYSSGDIELVMGTYILDSLDIFGHN